jgi:CubicO group peptidase (beta-lactamase class C family)
VQGTLATVLSLLALILSAQPAESQVYPSQIDSVFSSLQSNDAPGAAVLVIHNGRAVFHHGYGVTDLRTLDAIDEHTNFRLASLTKQFTATCVMLLVRDGKLHYEDRITDSSRNSRRLVRLLAFAIC